MPPNAKTLSGSYAYISGNAMGMILRGIGPNGRKKGSLSTHSSPKKELDMTENRWLSQNIVIHNIKAIITRLFAATSGDTRKKYFAMRKKIRTFAISFAMG